jgi:ribulose-5-phosphate 4-epimerase/fuculose-1-phosphate aldolase
VSYPGGDLRNQLAHVGAEAVRTGLVVGSGGNLSARAPGTDRCWITAAGSWLDRLDPSGFAQISIPDGVPRNGHPHPSSEWRLHTETYLRRPDVTAIVHLHPQTSVLLAALGYDIALITSDHAYYLREIAAVPFGHPGSVEFAAAAAEAVTGGVNVLILAHHGCSVLADSLIPRVPARFLDAVMRGEAQI